MTYIDPRSKVLYHVDRVAAIRAGERPAPVNVEIDLSNRCSLGCQACHFAYTHTRGPLAGKRDKPAGAVSGGDVMDTALALRVLDELQAAGVRSVTWTGGGEPTLHPQFDLIVSHCQLDQGIYTHGGHIGERRAALLKERCTWVYVSLDCADRDSYMRYKGADYFQRVIDGIEWLVRAPGKATVGVGFLLGRDNWRDGPSMIALGRSLGVDYINFRPMVMYDQVDPTRPAEDTRWMGPMIEWLRAIERWPGIETDAARFEMYRDWNGRPYTACHWTQVQTCITPNGKVWSCVNKREHPDAELGDLSRESFADIWRRSGPCTDFSRCRVMCRGHIGNISLHAALSAPRHENFI